MFKELFETQITETETEQNADENMKKIAQAIKDSKSIFDFPKALKKARLKGEAYGMGVVKATVKGKEYWIASEKKAEKGDSFILQNGYVIGPKS